MGFPLPGIFQSVAVAPLGPLGPLGPYHSSSKGSARKAILIWRCGTYNMDQYGSIWAYFMKSQLAVTGPSRQHCQQKSPVAWSDISQSRLHSRLSASCKCRKLDPLLGRATTPQPKTATGPLTTSVGWKFDSSFFGQRLPVNLKGFCTYVFTSNIFWKI